MKLICYYLPQFHPTPYNDEWWGKGFTEWTNVAKARPRFRGHHQPQIPADLGFYDLRLEETRIAQAELAKEYGIFGFCYFHYWFNGKMLLDFPLNEMLRSGKPDFPFCLCWANEKWTKAWEAHEKEVLVRQEYSEKDRLSHINWLCSVFKDPRYIRINNKPLLLIYRIDEIPDLKERIRDWRRIAQEHGFEGLYICFVRNYENKKIEDILSLGLDAMVEHQPSEESFPRRTINSLLKLALNKSLNKFISFFKLDKRVNLLQENRIFDYSLFANKVINAEHPKNYTKFPCVFPSWDNSARKRIAGIIQNDNADKYSEWLESSCNKVLEYPESEQVVFINAWNEWAEGCHLEPDLRNGRNFLEATKDVVNKFSKKNKI